MEKADTMAKEQEKLSKPDRQSKRKQMETASKRQRTLRKLQKMKFQRSLTHHNLSSTSSEINLEYEWKLRNLRINNRELAKTLSETRMEAQQWYKEVVRLRAEQIQTHDQRFEEAVKCEVEQRLRKLTEPLNASLSEAMKNVVLVVENLTETKTLVGTTIKNSKNRPSNIRTSSLGGLSLPRTPSSRLPLAPTGSGSGLRQKVVRPMVEGHVLHPAMVTLPKLDLAWQTRLHQRIEARQEQPADMSVIGEVPDSSAETSEIHTPEDPSSDNNSRASSPHLEENNESTVFSPDTADSQEQPVSQASQRARRGRRSRQNLFSQNNSRTSSPHLDDGNESTVFSPDIADGGGSDSITQEVEDIQEVVLDGPNAVSPERPVSQASQTARRGRRSRQNLFGHNNSRTSSPHLEDDNIFSPLAADVGGGDSITQEVEDIQEVVLDGPNVVSPELPVSPSPPRKARRGRPSKQNGESPVSSTVEPNTQSPELPVSPSPPRKARRGRPSKQNGESPVSSTVEPNTQSPERPDTSEVLPRARRGRRSRLNIGSPVSRRVDPEPNTQEDKNETSPKKNKSHSKPIEEDDPLEGPSWLYSDTGRKRGRGRGRPSRGRGTKKSKSSFREVTIYPSSEDEDLVDHMVSPKSATTTNLCITIEDDKQIPSPALDIIEDQNSKSNEDNASGKSSGSPEEEQGDAVDKSPTLGRGSTDNASSQVKTPPVSLEQSYLPSPATMLARFENLEANKGRRSKAKSRGKSLKPSTEQAGRASQAGIDRRHTRKATEIITGTQDDDQTLDESLNLQLEETLLPDAEEGSKSTESDDLLPPNLQNFRHNHNFLITDNDLTCIGDISMDMTEPISKIINQIGAGSKNSKPTDKKFFKKQAAELQDKENTDIEQEKQHSDFSIMDASTIVFPLVPNKTDQKENMPPPLQEADQEKYKPLNLRKVSIVLEDVMKSSPELSNNFTPTLTLTCSAKSAKSANLSSGKTQRRKPKSTKSESPQNKKPKKRKALTFSAVGEELDDSDSTKELDDDSWTPPKKGKKSSKSARKSAEPTRQRKSTAGRKRLSVTGITGGPAKKVARRKKGVNDLETPTTTPEISLVEEEEDKGKSSDKEDKGITKITLGVHDDASPSRNASYLKMDDCYVMIHKTPEVSPLKVVEADKSLMLRLDDTVESHDNSDDNLGRKIAMAIKKAELMNKAQDKEEQDDVNKGEQIPEEEDSEVDLEKLPEKELEEASTVEKTPEEDTEVCILEKVCEEEHELDKKNEEDEDEVCEVQNAPEKAEPEPRRKRGAALKISSFKEVGLNVKMRNSTDNTIFGLKMRKGRKSNK